MPEYEVYVNGRLKRVDLTKNGEGSYTAKVDGKSRSFSVAKDAIMSDKPFTVKVDDKSYRVELARASHTNGVAVTVDKTSFKVEVHVPSRKPAMAAFEPAMTEMKRRITSNRQVLEGAVNAPMTGKVVSIKVAKGESVKPKQVLCVIEAMKMENEISASKAGVVKEILVIVGSPVSEGDPLVVIV